MLHRIFHGLLKHVPWYRLEQFTGEYGADQGSRKLTTKRHLIALLYGQFSGAAGLREIVTGLASHEARLYHLGSCRCGARPCRTPTASGRGRRSATCSPRCRGRRIADCGARPARRCG